LFSWCSALTEVKMGENVASIGEYAFSNCEALSTVTMPASMKTVGEYAFSDCVNLTNVSLGDGVESVSSYAFYNCSGITNLDMGQSVQTIGMGAFGNCTGLQTLVIPDSTKTIEGQAFLGCTALADVTLGTGLERIGSYAFYDTAVFEAAEDIFYLNGWAIANKNADRAKLVLAEGYYYSETEESSVEGLEFAEYDDVCDQIDTWAEECKNIKWKAIVKEEKAEAEEEKVQDGQDIVIEVGDEDVENPSFVTEGNQCEW
jgi:hypothetical protein